MLQHCLRTGKCKENYKGIIEIYPTKFTNSFVLDSLLVELQDNYEIVKITNGWIRAFKKEKRNGK